MDEHSDNIIIDENFIDTEKNNLDSFRIPTRRTESYSSYVPKRNYNNDDNDSEPLLPKSKGKSSKTCFRSPHSENGGKRSVFQFLPVVFVLFVFSVIYGTFLIYYLKHEINQDLAHYGVLTDRVIVHTFITHFLLIILSVCYLLCVFKTPGTIPDTMEWSLSNKDINTNSVLYETKKSGARRVCKWCYRYKPDRTHHCRTCGSCTLKMDHHCPWANNCIGYRNYKYFYLTIFYSDIFLIYIAILLFPTVRYVCKNSLIPLSEVVLILSSEVLACFLALVLTCFFFFHTWLISQNFTTIEFCEKYYSSKNHLDVSIWSDGIYRNITSVLGKNPLLWFIPYANLDGNGITFKRGDMSRDFEDLEQPIVIKNSVFMKMARDSKQFDPEIGDETP